MSRAAALLLLMLLLLMCPVPAMAGQSRGPALGNKSSRRKTKPPQTKNSITKTPRVPEKTDDPEAVTICFVDRAGGTLIARWPAYASFEQFFKQVEVQKQQPCCFFFGLGEVQLEPAQCPADFIATNGAMTLFADTEFDLLRDKFYKVFLGHQPVEQSFKPMSRSNQDCQEVVPKASWTVFIGDRFPDFTQSAQQLFQDTFGPVVKEVDQATFELAFQTRYIARQPLVLTLEETLPRNKSEVVAKTQPDELLLALGTPFACDNCIRLKVQTAGINGSCKMVGFATLVGSN